MPIVRVELTDTFDQWRQKDNAMIDLVNTLGSEGQVVATQSPITGQLLVFDGTVFSNVTLSGDATINSSGVITVTGGANGLSKGRLRFAGAMTGLY
jgi:hypothetical protein